jgi:hypothetical protein
MATDQTLRYVETAKKRAKELKALALKEIKLVTDANQLEAWRTNHVGVKSHIRKEMDQLYQIENIWYRQLAGKEYHKVIAELSTMFTVLQSRIGRPA